MMWALVVTVCVQQLAVAWLVVALGKSERKRRGWQIRAEFFEQARDMYSEMAAQESEQHRAAVMQALENHKARQEMN